MPIQGIEPAGLSWMAQAKAVAQADGLFVAFVLSLFWGVPTGRAADKSGVTPNTISLPQGPGSIEGLGESFEPTLNTGTAKYQVALKVPPGTAGHAPTLALQYDGGGSNGPLGFGWSLEIPFVQRQTDKGIPRYVDRDNGADDDGDGSIDEPDEIDVFINDLKEELVLTAGGYYFCENEGPFIRYRRVKDDTHDGWQGTLPDGTLMEFGLTAGARIVDAGTGRIFRWMLERMTDTNGNTIVYTYRPGEKHPNQRYLQKVQYGPGAPPWTNYHFVVFEYEDRPDWFEDGRSGFIVRTEKRVREIVIGTQGPSLAGHASGDFDHDGKMDHLNRRYVLAYDAHPHWSLLSSVTWVGADNVSTYPPLRLQYTVANPPDIISATGQIVGSVNTPSHVMDSDLVDLADLNGDALPDILKTDRFGGAHTAYLNEGQVGDAPYQAIRWSPLRGVEGDQRAWNINLQNNSNAIAHLADMDGDGLADLTYKSAVGDVYVFRNEANLCWGSRFLMNADPSDAAPPSPFGTENVKTADLDFDKKMDIIQSIDDGSRYRIWFNLGDRRFSRSRTVDQDFGFSLSAPGVHIADFNGDRVPDILRIRPTGLQVTAGLGYGRFAPLIFVPLPDYTLDVEQFGQVGRARLQDITGDGLVDLVIERAVPGQLWYWINLGNYTLDKRRLITGMPTGLGLEPAIRWADMNGNGTTDLVYADSQRDPALQVVDLGELLGCVPSPNMLVNIDNSIGRKIAIQYATSTRYLLADLADGHAWPDPLPFPVHVVSKVVVDDSMDHQYVTEYTYHDGYYDGQEREFRGFAAVEKRGVGDATAPDLVTAHKFDTGATTRALKGKLLELEARTAQREVFYRESYHWQSRTLMSGSNGDGRSVAFPYQDTKIRDVIEQDSDTPVQLKWEYRYDDYGNMTYMMEHGYLGEGWNDERVTETSTTAAYPDGVSKWLIRGVVEQKTMDENGMMAAHQRNYYDGNALLGAVEKGNLTRTEDWVEGSHYTVSLRNDCDKYGNIVSVYDPLYGTEPGHYRELTYDEAFRTFPEKEVVHTGNLTVPSLTFGAGYDMGFGVVTSSTEFNGHTTTYGYDAFGRVNSMTKPPFSGHTREYDYVLAHDMGGGRIVNWVETRQRDDSPSDGFFHSRIVSDGLGRKLASVEEGEQGFVVSEAVLFNAAGTPRYAFMPYAAESAEYAPPVVGAPAAEIRYDATGREVLRCNPPDVAGVITSAATEYLPLKTTVTDENGIRKHSIQDGLERLTQVHEENQGETYITRYEYDTLGNLTRITDAQDNVSTLVYDGLSRRILLNDPDRGRYEYTYDDAGNLIRTVDNKRQVIVDTYDGANRLLTEDYLDAAAITPDIAYLYDSPSGDYPYAQNTRGRMVRVLDLSGASFFSYDVRGNAEWSVNRIQDSGLAHDFMFMAEYDAMDRVVRQTFPDGDGISYTYNSGSLLEAIPGILNNIDYYPSEQIKTYAYANGLTTTYAYDPRNRLSRLTTDTAVPSGNPLQDLSYTFDDADNITAIADHRSLPLDSPKNATQFFQYDDLYRLTKAEGPGSGAIIYQYDKIGNMIFQGSPASPDPQHINDALINTGVMTSGGAGGTSGRGLKRPGDPPGPHAITSTASGLAFDYDDNGNMTYHAEDICEWDYGDRLIKIATRDTAATYVYDYTGLRVIKKSKTPTNTSAVYYVDRNYEIRDGKAIKYVFDGNRRVARIEGRLTGTNQEGTPGANRDAGRSFASLDVEPDDEAMNREPAPRAGTYSDIGICDPCTRLYGDHIPAQHMNNLTEIRASQGHELGTTMSASLPTTGTRAISNMDVQVADVAQPNRYQQSGRVYFYHPDHLGSSNMVTDSTGAVVESTEFYPYGRPRHEERAHFQSSYRYAGKELDRETGLLYYGARYYDPTLCRFISVDPLFQAPASTHHSVTEEHAYAVAGSNPITWTDPDGHRRTRALSPEQKRDLTLKGTGRLGELAELLSAWEYKWDPKTHTGKAGTLDKLSGRFKGRGTQCTSFGRVATAVLLGTDLSDLPRLGTKKHPLSVGQAFKLDQVKGKEGFLERKDLNHLDRTRVYGVQSYELVKGKGPQMRHWFFLLYNAELGSWQTVESTFANNAKGIFTSGSPKDTSATGTDVFFLRHKRSGRTARYKVYDIDDQSILQGDLGKTLSDFEEPDK